MTDVACFAAKTPGPDATIISTLSRTLAARHRIPTVYSNGEYAKAGGLIAVRKVALDSDKFIGSFRWKRARIGTVGSAAAHAARCITLRCGCDTPVMTQPSRTCLALRPERCPLSP
jgi:hypothetical protein